MTKINTIDELFKLDDLRTKYCDENNLTALKYSYKKNTSIINFNTSDFWSEHLNNQYCTNDPMRDDRIKTVRKMIDPDSISLLNIGVGDGRLEVDLNRNKHLQELIGVDITQTGLQKAMKRAKFNGVVGSINQLPINKQFDTITILEVLEHLLFSQISNVMKEINRLLKPTGELIISVPINEHYTSSFNPNGHLRRYSIKLITNELIIHGFKPKETILLTAFNTHYKVKKIISKIITNRWLPNVVIIKSKKINKP
ncbi:class I SAM-dependent methyltransferase [Pseudomonadota bacterium]